MANTRCGWDRAGLAIYFNYCPARLSRAEWLNGWMAIRKSAKTLTREINFREPCCHILQQPQPQPQQMQFLEVKWSLAGIVELWAGPSGVLIWIDFRQQRGCLGLAQDSNCNMLQSKCGHLQLIRIAAAAQGTHKSACSWPSPLSASLCGI